VHYFKSVEIKGFKKEEFNIKVIKTLIDEETGQKINIFEGDTLKLVKKNQKEAIHKSIQTKELNEEVKEWNNELGGFVFVLFKYCDQIFKENPELTSDDIIKLFYLATFVDYEGYLINNDAYLKRKDMNNLLGINTKNFDLFFNKMKKLGIFIQDEDKCIMINKGFFYKGELEKTIQKNYNYTRVYINTIRYLFEHVPKKNHKQLGAYFKLIPYIHRQQNTLCWNPDSDKSEIKLMHVKDLKDILGYHRNSVRGFINGLLSIRLENDEAILGFFRTDYDEGKSYIIINPKVFYGGNFKLVEGKDEMIKLFKTL
jgi:DNA-binding transcriptional MerR regulator